MGTFELADLGALGAILFVIAVFVFLGFTCGLVRMFFGLVALAIGVLAAYWGFQRGPAVAATVVTDPDPWMAGAVGIGMGGALFLASRALFGVLIRPIRVVNGRKKNLPGAGAVLGFCAGIVFVWFLLSGIRYVGSLAELKRIRDSVAGDAVVKTDEAVIVKVKRIIDRSLPGRLHEHLDFLNDRARCTLAKLQIVVQNRDAITLAVRDPAVRKTFGQPDIRQMLETSPELNTFVEEGQFTQLLESKKLRQVASRPGARTVLSHADIEVALGFAVPVSDTGATAKK